MNSTYPFSTSTADEKDRSRDRSVVARVRVYAYCMRAINIALGTRKFGSAVLVRESNMELLKYSLDIRVRYSSYMFTDFQVSERLHRGPKISHI